MRILAPHKMQDGYVYLRLRVRRRGANGGVFVKLMRDIPGDIIGYLDNRPSQRIISSRRVEEAVETADYLKRCAEEGLSAYWMTKPRGSEYTVDGKTEVPYPCWVIERWTDEVTIDGRCGAASTLREAYWRFTTDE